SAGAVLPPRPFVVGGVAELVRHIHGADPTGRAALNVGGAPRAGRSTLASRCTSTLTPFWVRRVSSAPPGMARPPSSVAGWPIADTRNGGLRLVPSSTILPSSSPNAEVAPTRWSLTATASAPAS